ncbi:MAG: flagellar motor switch protein FliG [Treponema sp.]|jgi:flagellar motor switch protein FliG|nr:flagellar motor switch protein FliG [Treponema sp.]
MGKFHLPGINAYRQVLKQKNSSPEVQPAGARDLPEEDEVLNQTGAVYKNPVEGFLKAGPAVPPGQIKKPRGGFLRRPPKISPSPETAGQRDSKYRRLAKFLILIGSDDAAQVLSFLDLEQAEAISKEIASVRGIGGDEAEDILEEFRSLLANFYHYGGISVGGVDTARRILYAAYGPEKGETLLNKALPQTKENPLGFLEDFSGKDLALLLKNEIPVTAALILSRLSPRLSADILANMDEGRKAEVARCIARQREIAPEVLEQVAAGLRERARHIGGTDADSVDGMGALTAILKSSGFAFGDRILDELAEDSPELGRTLKERLHTLDDVVKMDDIPLQKKLQDMSDREIALLLKGRHEAFAEKILSNVSAQRRALIREEGEIMGGVLKKDADAAARDFLAWFRLNREEGRILLIDDGDIIL